ncbi:glycosyltransferase family 4 protein [Clostridium bornimense]|uniref:glycosyltransferase family 4 protein n=1 Tax=Clostridium bornimense TaxID=1216932 RepID=UPI001C106329|nr:glycosyltransferase family 4 protein [Clostridium bornimense]MBU5317704.1 glycosyltransferase family 4 protein [Clostridium bornimense]
MKNKTVLFIMPRLPFPASSGRKTSLYHYCRILSEELNCKLIVAAFLENGDSIDDKPSFIDELIILPKSSIFTKIKNICYYSLLIRRFPLQVSLFWNKKAKMIIQELVAKYQPDYAIADMVRCTEYIKDIDAVRVADLDDRISLRYKRQLITDINSINPYGAFINSVPNIFKNFMMNRHVKEYVLKNEIKLLSEYELSMGRECELTVFVAQSEADDFNKELGKNKAIAIPIGVDVNYFQAKKSHEKENYIGFLGAMSVAHNENAVKHFINDIFPLILDRINNAKFIVVGGGSSEELLSFASDNIIFTGRVEDVRDYLNQCKVFVCPMMFGSGIKTKNLEAMSMGLPIVSSSVGAENINATNGVDMIITDSNEEFANSVIKLLLDDEYRNRISENSVDFINKNWTWDRAKEIFGKI